MILPGGQIIGGMGGHILVGPMGASSEALLNPGHTSGAVQPVDGSLFVIDVKRWELYRNWIEAECPHSGTYGAITRRVVAFDWYFQANMPLDQNNFPELAFEPVPLSEVDTYAQWINCAVALWLGDVTINPEAVAMGMTQSIYYAPVAQLHTSVTALDASADVIRASVQVKGNSRLWLLPNDQEDSDEAYLYYKAKGYLV